MATQPQVFRREGDYWTVVFASATCRLRDTRGLHDLAYLLRRPLQEITPLEILKARPSGTTAAEPDDDGARERARVNVTRAIKTVLTRITAQHPYLGEHLRVTIRTGKVCVYAPDPRLSAHWES